MLSRGDFFLNCKKHFHGCSDYRAAAQVLHQFPFRKEDEDLIENFVEVLENIFETIILDKVDKKSTSLIFEIQKKGLKFEDLVDIDQYVLPTGMPESFVVTDETLNKLDNENLKKIIFDVFHEFFSWVFKFRNISSKKILKNFHLFVKESLFLEIIHIKPSPFIFFQKMQLNLSKNKLENNFVASFRNG